MDEVKEIVFTVALAICFCFCVFTIRSCVTENNRIDLEKLKYPVKVEREYTQKSSYETKPQNQQ